MIRDVELTEGALKDLKKIPKHVANRLKLWVYTVETVGLENTRLIPGYHDEPLKGKREGQRSIRLNKAYRAFYIIKVRENGQEEVQFVSVEEVNKHKY